MPTEFDPNTVTLTVFLTAAGATIGAALIAGLIALAKNLGGIGAWIDAGHEPAVALVLSAILVILAYASTLTALGGTAEVTIAGVFAAFLAWYGIASIASKVHDNVSTIRGDG